MTKFLIQGIFLLCLFSCERNVPPTGEKAPLQLYRLSLSIPSLVIVKLNPLEITSLKEKYDDNDFYIIADDQNGVSRVDLLELLE